MVIDAGWGRVSRWGGGVQGVRWGGLATAERAAFGCGHADATRARERAGPGAGHIFVVFDRASFGKYMRGTSSDSKDGV